MRTDIRTAAQREAEILYPIIPEVQVENRGRRLRQKAFIKGAVWGAARVTPTREQIAEAIGGSEDYPGPKSYLKHADAVLALMQELAEGESK